MGIGMEAYKCETPEMMQVHTPWYHDCHTCGLQILFYFFMINGEMRYGDIVVSFLAEIEFVSEVISCEDVDSYACNK